MTIKEHPNGKIIIFSRPLYTGNNIIYFTIFFLFGLLFLKLIVTSDKIDTPFLLICSMMVPAILLLIAYRFIEKALQREKLIISKRELTLLSTGFFTGRKRIYDTRHIENFRHIVESDPIKQPEPDGSGELTEAQIKQYLAKRRIENRLAFDYKGHTIKFGANIYSWDFDQLEVIFHDITGDDPHFSINPFTFS